MDSGQFHPSCIQWERSGGYCSIQEYSARFLFKQSMRASTELKYRIKQKSRMPCRAYTVCSPIRLLSPCPLLAWETIFYPLYYCLFSVKPV